MRLIVSTHNNTASRLSGKHQEMYNEEIDYVVVHDMDDGEYAIMQDHIPVAAAGMNTLRVSLSWAIPGWRNRSFSPPVQKQVRVS